MITAGGEEEEEGGGGEHEEGGASVKDGRVWETQEPTEEELRHLVESAHRQRLRE